MLSAAVLVRHAPATKKSAGINEAGMVDWAGNCGIYIDLFFCLSNVSAYFIVKRDLINWETF